MKYQDIFEYFRHLEDTCYPQQVFSKEQELRHLYSCDKEKFYQEMKRQKVSTKRKAIFEEWYQKNNISKIENLT